jgi:hypothetical protein
MTDRTDFLSALNRNLTDSTALQGSLPANLRSAASVYSQAQIDALLLNYYTSSQADGLLNNKAAKGANSDITSLSGLTTPLSPAQGGTGVGTLAALKTALSLDTAVLGSTGATDNRLLRSDGTGGATLQNSAITVDDSGNISGAGTFNTATVDESAWSSYTPTITSGSGTITTYTSSGKYKRLFGRTVIVRIRATLTTVGTASGNMLFTLPITAATGAPVPTVQGRESGTTGKMVSGALNNSTTAYVVFYDAASVFGGGNGTIVDATFTYETAS